MKLKFEHRPCAIWQMNPCENNLVWPKGPRSRVKFRSSFVFWRVFLKLWNETLRENLNGRNAGIFFGARNTHITEANFNHQTLCWWKRRDYMSSQTKSGIALKKSWENMGNDRKHGKWHQTWEMIGNMGNHRKHEKSRETPGCFSSVF